MADDRSTTRPAPRRSLRDGFPALRVSLVALGGLAVVMVLVLVLLPSGPAPPSVAEIAALAVSPPEDAPPAAGADALLPAGWRAVGARDDDPGGRETAIVVYAKGDLRLGHAVVEGPPLEAPAGAAETREGVRYVVIPRGVTWERHGRTHVLAGSAGVPPDELLALAARLR